MSEDREYQFAKLSEHDAYDVKNMADDPAVALLAVCVASQQAAGFKNHLDLRAAPCPECGAPGYNTGWGYWRHACGAEVLSSGESGEPCGQSPDGRASLQSDA